MCYETKNQSDRQSLRPSEPADPDRLSHDVRRQLPLAPDSVDFERFPDALLDDGRPVSVDDARQAYLKIQRHWSNNDPSKMKVRDSERHYWRIMETDRRLQSDYDGLTTVLLTRRLSPVTDDGKWELPWDCDQMLHGNSVHRSIRESFYHHLGDFDFEWVAVTSPTKSVGTPHEHIYIWIDDPDNEITTDHIKPALDKHLKRCANAYEKHHRVTAEGTKGPITHHHNPETKDDGQTVGAGYVARQLAHLPFADVLDECYPPDAKLEGAALAWASPFDWFRSSSGV